MDTEMDWERMEEQVVHSLTRLVYSDEDEFYDEPWPEKIIFVKKQGTDSYVMKYNALTHLFIHYKVPHYNRKCATMRLQCKGDPATSTDVHGNEILIDKYRIV